MVKRFLLLFSAHRDLLLAKSRAEVEAEFWRERCARTEEHLRVVSDRLLTNAEKTADVLSQQALGRRLFSRAEMPLDAGRDPNLISSLRIPAGERQRKTAEARGNLKQFYEREMKQDPVT